MRYILVTQLLLVMLTEGFAQYSHHKPFIDSSVLVPEIGNRWPDVDHHPKISPNGHYIVYQINNPASTKIELTIQSVDGKWKRTYDAKSRSACYFDVDEKLAVFQLGDSLHLVPLGKAGEDLVIAGRLVMPPYTALIHQIVYREKKSAHEKLLDLTLNQEKDLGAGIKDIFFDNGFHPSILFFQSIENDIPVICYYDLTSKQTKTIWTGLMGDKIFFRPQDKNGLVLFIVTRKKGNVENESLWFWNMGENNAHVLIEDGDSRLPSGARINPSAVLSGNGHWVFFTLKKPSPSSPLKPNPKLSKVNVWSYKDPVIQPGQAHSAEVAVNEPITCSIGIDGKNFQVLADSNDELAMSVNDIPGDEFLVRPYDSSAEWMPNLGAFAYPRNYYLVSLRDRGKQLLKKDSYFNYPSFSPDGDWLTWWDGKEGRWTSYNIANHRSYDFTKKIKDQLEMDRDGHDYSVQNGRCQASWYNHKVLIYGRYDLWAIDPEGKMPPENLTDGFGTGNHIRLRLCDQKKLYHKGDTLMYAGFKDNNKQNGFFRQILATSKSLQELTFGPYQYYTPPGIFDIGEGDSFDFGMEPVKAAHTNAWIVMRQTASEYPNLYFTSDFKDFRNLTNLAPQEKYNWLTAELIHYKQLDGTQGAAILYKPEDFDPKQRYPVIIHFYEDRTHRLYQFPQPDYDADDISVPWFTSRGYLVVTPAIHYKSAAESNKTNGEWALNALEGCCQYLATLPYVNNRIGLQGHSFGAIQGFYLVTHSHQFAAAELFSGVSDAISNYDELLPDQTGNEYHSGQDNVQERFAVSLFERPDLYVKESAVLNVKQVTTPLLLIHNPLDGALNWHQSIEMYMALRYLRKPGWLITYDGEFHSLLKGVDMIDHTLRLNQFFDHYLKGYPPPVWMTKGIPAIEKGVKTGYELDPEGNCSSNCAICKQKDYRAYYDQQKEKDNETSKNNK